MQSCIWVIVNVLPEDLACYLFSSYCGHDKTVDRVISQPHGPG
jgi:hypothetical protein